MSGLSPFAYSQLSSSEFWHSQRAEPELVPHLSPHIRELQCIGLHVVLAQSICAVESSNVTSGVTANLRSPRGYASPQQLSEQVSDLKIELARRDAEVEYLEAQLAEAVAAHRPHTRSPADRCPDKVKHVLEENTVLQRRATQWQTAL